RAEREQKKTGALTAPVFRWKRSLLLALVLVLVLSFLGALALTDVAVHLGSTIDVALRVVVLGREDVVTFDVLVLLLLVALSLGLFLGHVSLLHLVTLVLVALRLVRPAFLQLAPQTQLLL